MSEYINYNLHRYLFQDTKKYQWIWFVPICLFLLLFFLAYKHTAYEVIEVKGQTFCNEECTINFFYPADSFIYEFIKIKNQTYDVQKIEFADPILDGNNNALQNITLTLKEYKGNHNEFVVLKIFKNKENMLKKITKIIKER